MNFPASMSALQAYLTIWFLEVLGAGAVFVLGMWAAKQLRNLTRRAVERSPIDPSLAGFFSGLAYFGVVAVVVLAVLGIFGIPTASFVAVLGAAGLAVGLAFQGTLSNFAAGVMLLTFRPFRLDDVVEVGGNTGKVTEMGVFSCTLTTPDNIRIIVPNSNIFGQTIKNLTVNETRRIDLVMGVSYDDDLQVAKETMLAVLSEDERILTDPAPSVEVAELADSSVNFVVRPWVKTADYWAVRFHIIPLMKTRLEAAGCSIPFPQRDVHLFRTDGGETAVA